MPNLITPMQSGSQLTDDIQQTQPGPNQVAIWWFGQSGYCIKSASATFYVDLYLSEHLTHKYAATEKPHIRMTHAPLRGADLRDVQLVFASHKHSDHLDPGTLPDLFTAKPEARLVLSLALVDHAVNLGLDHERLLPVRGDDSLDLDDLKVHVLPSAHPDLDYDPATGYPFLGFVFETAGLRLYHSGDTIIYDGLAERLAALPVDLAFLPINGTDTRRKAFHTPPNMNIDEALALASQIGGPLVIPHHYDMFTFNTADVGQFTAAADARGQAYRVLQCGEKFLFSPDAASS